MAEIHIQRGDFSSCFIKTGSKSSLAYIVFQTHKLSSCNHLLMRYTCSHIFSSMRGYTCVRKQEHFILCQTRIFRGIFAGEFASCLLQETDVYPVIPPMELMQHVKGIFSLISNILLLLFLLLQMLLLLLLLYFLSNFLLSSSSLLVLLSFSVKFPSLNTIFIVSPFFI